MKRSLFCRPWCVLALLQAACLPAHAADKPATRVPVYCPALGTEDRPRSNTLGESPRQPTLVVLGTARRVGKEEQTISQKTEIVVEKVLFGSSPGRKFSCLSGWDFRPDEKPQRLIFALTPVLDSDRFPFEIRYTLPPEEEKAVAALSAARMDYNALSAEIVFVGKEVSADADKGRVNEVVRVLRGPDTLKGKKVCVDLLEHPLRTGFTVPPKPLPTKGEHLYFVAAVDREYKKRQLRSITNPDGPVYLVPYRLPADQEKNVVAALKRRDQYPIVEIEEDGEKVKYREIQFRGSIAEAVGLLGSESRGAVLLGGRFLMHNPNEARKPVLAAIEGDLLRTERKDGFRRLHHLIYLLRRLLPPEPRKEELDRLIEKWLAHLAKNPGEPPAVKREPWETYHDSEENHTDINHSLAWLIDQLPEEQVVRQYGKRLLALRDLMTGRWKQEVQLALEVANVEDHLDLAHVWPRMKDVRPLRSKTGLRHPGGKNEGPVAFSPDGKHLATVDGDDLRVWQTKDWTLAAPAIPLEGSLSRLVFSPDGKYLYVAGGGGGLQIHARYDWKAGKLDRAYKGHKSGLADLALSADGKTMVTSNYYEKVFLVWDTDTGKTLKRFQGTGVASKFALSPDGLTLLRQKSEGGALSSTKTEWAVEELGPGALKVPGSVFQGEPYQFSFTADGRYLLGLVAHRNRKEDRETQLHLSDLKRETRLHLWDVKHGFRETASIAVEMDCDHLSVSPTGKFVVVVAGRGYSGFLVDGSGIDARVFTLSDLKLIKRFSIPLEDSDRIKSVRISPDGKLLAVGAFLHATPLFFRTDSFEQVVFFDGHADNIRALFFLRDGKTIRTFGSANDVCTWDATTLRMIRRERLPSKGAPLSISPREGRYCVVRTSEEGAKEAIRVFDVEQKRLLPSLNVSSGLFDPHFVWLGERELIAAEVSSFTHFDFLTGKELGKHKESSETFNGRGFPTEDGKSLIEIQACAKNQVVDVNRIDVQTGELTQLGKVTLKRFSGNSRGLVPGGKYFYIGDPGMYVFDRQTLKLVSARHF
ncbi:MAG TPA: WD40 repeat domain-containing protein, partial [Gemmataceae bacterium]|nr:WD40 repeat domain-containing protein [Gemmataceae bacterium]